MKSLEVGCAGSGLPFYYHLFIYVRAVLEHTVGGTLFQEGWPRWCFGEKTLVVERQANGKSEVMTVQNFISKHKVTSVGRLKPASFPAGQCPRKLDPAKEAEAMGHLGLPIVCQAFVFAGELACRSFFSICRCRGAGVPLFCQYQMFTVFFFSCSQRAAFLQHPSSPPRQHYTLQSGIEPSPREHYTSHSGIS